MSKNKFKHYQTGLPVSATEVALPLGLVTGTVTIATRQALHRIGMSVAKRTGNYELIDEEQIDGLVNSQLFLECVEYVLRTTPETDAVKNAFKNALDRKEKRPSTGQVKWGGHCQHCGRVMKLTFRNATHLVDCLKWHRDRRLFTWSERNEMNARQKELENV